MGPTISATTWTCEAGALGHASVNRSPHAGSALDGRPDEFFERAAGARGGRARVVGP